MNHQLLSSTPAPALSSAPIGTYPPTKCGIATCTANVRSGLVQAGFDCGVARVMARSDASDRRSPLEPNDEVVVATAFPHAVELSRKGAVQMVEHDDDEAIADDLARIFADDRMHDRMQAAARDESARYDWPIVSARMRSLIETSLRDIAQVHPLAG